MKGYIKSIALAALIAMGVLFFSVRAVAPSLPRVVGRPVIEETHRFSWPDAERFVLENHDGTIRIWPHAAQEIAATANVRIYMVRRGEDGTATTYAETLFGATADAREVRVVTEPAERPDLIEVRVDYDVFVPRGTDIEVMSANGNVHVASGCGRVNIEGRNADIFVRKPQGMVTAQTTNGRIDVVDAPDGARLQTVNGNIYAHMLGGAVSADTSNGVIVAHLLDPRVNSAELNSMNGGITLVMDERCSANIDARTMHGGVRSDFPVDTSSGVRRHRHLRGKIGEGHTALSLQTLNGNIWLARGRR